MGVCWGAFVLSCWFGIGEVRLCGVRHLVAMGECIDLGDVLGCGCTICQMVHVQLVLDVRL